MLGKLLTVVLLLYALVQLAATGSQYSGGEGRGEPMEVVFKDIIPQRLNEKIYFDKILSNDYLVVFYYLSTLHNPVEFVESVNAVCKDIKKKYRDFDFGYVTDENGHALMKDFSIDRFPLAQVFVQQVGILYEKADDSNDFDDLPILISQILTRKCSIAKKASDIKLKWNFSILVHNTEKLFLDRLFGIISMKYRDSANVFQVEAPEVMNVAAKDLGIDIKASGFALIIHHTHNNRVTIFDGAIHPYNIGLWLTENYKPDISQLTYTTYEWAMNEGLVILALFYHSADITKDRIDVMYQLGPHIRQKGAIAVLADMNNDFPKDFASRNGLHSYIHCLVAIKPFMPGIPKYMYQGQAFTVSEILEFIHDYQAMSAQQFYKSESINSTMLGKLGVISAN